MTDPLNLTSEALLALGCFTVLVPGMPKAWVGPPRLMRANLFGVVRAISLLMLVALAISAEDRVKGGIAGASLVWIVYLGLSGEGD